MFASMARNGRADRSSLLQLTFCRCCVSINQVATGKPSKLQGPQHGEPMNDTELIRRAKIGDQSAMATLLEAHATRAFRLALHITGNKSDAEDATQNAFVKAYTQLGRFEERSAFGTWLLRIVTREALNQRRAETTRWRFWQHQGDGEEIDTSVESAVQVRVEQQELWRAVNRLKVKDRTVLTLSYFMGMTNAEVAETLGIKKGTVKMRKHTAIKRLRALVGSEFPELAPETQRKTASEGSPR